MLYFYFLLIVIVIIGFISYYNNDANGVLPGHHHSTTAGQTGDGDITKNDNDNTSSTSSTNQVQESTAQQVRTLLNGLSRENNTYTIAMIDSPCGYLLPNMTNGYDAISQQSVISLLSRLRNIPAKTPVDIILHTQGGELAAGIQMALALANREAPTRVFVPFTSCSSGTVISLGVSAIYMDENAILGPIDPQIGISLESINTDDSHDDDAAKQVITNHRVAATDLAKLNSPNNNNNNNSHSNELILAAELANKWNETGSKWFRRIMSTHYNEPIIRKVIDELASGKLPHDSPVRASDAHQLGLNVFSGSLDSRVYEIVELVINDTCRKGRNTVYDSVDSCIMVNGSRGTIQKPIAPSCGIKCRLF